MVEVKEFDVTVPSAFDPFGESEEFGGIHPYQQRNGRKSSTTVQGLNKYERILKDLKKEFCCNGNVVQDKELGKILQLQRDQRDKVSHFLLQAGLVPNEDRIKIHGF